MASIEIKKSSNRNPSLTMKDLKASDPRWCTGCGDYTILVGMRKFMVDNQIQPKDTVHVSGIGCSGRVPHYLNTYGLHGIHGRAVPLALGIVLARPDLKVFIHSGDGDSLSIGGNHLLHGIHKNFNCVYVLFDNQIYGLTKQQTSPTSRQGLITQTQPTGSYMEPLNPIKFALGLGASFVASTAEWMGAHMVATIDAAYKHPGFSFVHVAQRCPKFNPAAWNYQGSDWVTFLTHETHGISPDHKAAPDALTTSHDPYDLEAANTQANLVPNIFGLFYKTQKPLYNDLMTDIVNQAPIRDRSKLLDEYVI
jgi:2-oxoglutarate ferredoxin oxidoreductase subunit beta